MRLNETLITPKQIGSSLAIASLSHRLNILPETDPRLMMRMSQIIDRYPWIELRIELMRWKPSHWGPPSSETTFFANGLKNHMYLIYWISVIIRLTSRRHIRSLSTQVLGMYYVGQAVNLPCLYCLGTPPRILYPEFYIQCPNKLSTTPPPHGGARGANISEPIW